MEDNAKIIDLEKRIARLEDAGKNVYNYYKATKERIYASKIHEANFKFKIICEECLRFVLNVKTLCNDYSVTVELDGNRAFMVTARELDSRIEFMLPLSAGEKNLCVKLESSSSFMAEITLETFGAIEYPDEECFVTVLNEEAKSTICCCYDDDLLVKEYTGDIRTVIQKAEVKSGTICKLGNIFVLFYIDHNNILQCEYFTDDEYDTIGSCPIDQNVTSVCALSGSDAATAYSVKGGRVFRYTIDGNFNLATHKTEYGAKRVSCDPGLPGYIIITDYSGNGKIIKI